MFLLNSCLNLFSAACLRRLPLSRSYGDILPSSLAMLLPSALGFSPHPPVSVCGTGTIRTIAAFLDGPSIHSPTFVRSSQESGSRYKDLPHNTSLPFPGFPFPVELCIRVLTVLSYRSTGISTCRPSTTAFALALGPDLPRADQLDSGNLGYSAERILTFLSLLIPAFSLPMPPRPLSITLP